MDPKFNCSRNSVKVKYFEIFRNDLYSPDDMRKGIRFPTFVSIDMPKAWLAFSLHLNICNHLTSSWKKSGQQTAFNHTSERLTLNMDFM